MQKVNPGRESASSQRGDGRHAEKSGVSENHRILGYSPNRCSRLVADQVRAVKAPLLDVQIPLWNQKVSISHTHEIPEMSESLSKVPMEHPVPALLPSLAALPHGSCGAREPGLHFHPGLGVLPSSLTITWDAVMSLHFVCKKTCGECTESSTGTQRFSRLWL